jgi:hypothetical protein
MNKRLVITFGFKAAGAIPKILYLGHDVDEAKSALEAAKEKGYYEIRVCRDCDRTWLHRFKAVPVNIS